MTSLIPERFVFIRNLREDRRSKTFLANDHLLDREKVIVRIIKKEHLRADRNRLIEHFSWTIGVQHSQFASVLDAGLTKQQHLYYVREYLPPSELLSVDPLSVMKSLVSAVDFLSTHGRVHGAIKPSNIFVTKEMCKLADATFCAPELDDEESVHFAAPEILRGGDISHEGDLYSLGAVVYWILVGRHLFEDPDLIHLKSKYLSASPQPAWCLSQLSQSISELALELLGKNPAQRPIAFERLKRAIQVDSVAADRAPFIGRDNLFKQVLATVEKPPTSLRVLLLEGEIGIGKSRFVGEMRLHCAFRGSRFVASQCVADSTELAPVRECLQKLLRSSLGSLDVGSTFDLRSVTPAVSAYLMASSSSPAQIEKGYPLEKKMSDLIGLMGSLSRRVPTVITLEDVDLADTGTLRFLDQLAFRGSEIPITLVLTNQPSEDEPKWIDTMTACLGTDFVRFNLPPLSEHESERLVQFLENNHERRLSVVQFSGGNPLFIQTCANYKSSSDFASALDVDATDSLVSRLTRQTRAILEVLSVFRKPVPARVLAVLCEKSLSDVECKLEAASRLGLITRSAETVGVRFPIIRKRLYASVSKKTRLRLNRKAFLALRELDSDMEALSHYAFEGGMFAEAGALYRDLAIGAFKLQKYRPASNCYERLRQCCERSGQSFTPAETLNLARCYDKAGKQRFSDRLYRELLSFEEVQHDPVLLSIVYTRLAMTTAEISTKERSRLLELAIQCLPATSSHFGRVAFVSTAFSKLGDLHRASELLKRLEECVIRDKKDSDLLHLSRATLLCNSGDFRGAAVNYLPCLTDGIQQDVVLNNLAFCFENLGDLNTALKYQLRARELAILNGDVFVENQSLDNIAAIKTKCGDMREAEYLLNQAREGIRALNAGNMVDKNTLCLSVAADTVTHALYRGDYKVARDYIKEIRILAGLASTFDRMQCEITCCKFLIAVGVTKKARELLRRLGELAIFKIDFLQIERALLEAQFPDLLAKDKLERLQHALTLSQNLGTLYQRCEVLISLAAVHLELDERQMAEECVKKALGLANKNGYKLLAARALLLSGLASEKQRDKQHFLSDAFQLASEIGLQELIAEAGFHIGILNLESGNIVTAREYLIRSTSITARLTDGVPIAARPKYLAKKWRRYALLALDRCNESIPLNAWSLFNDEADKYFAAAYRFTMTAAVANSLEGLLASIEKLVTSALTRSIVIRLKKGPDSFSITVRSKMSPELAQRIEVIRTRAKQRIYFDSAEERGKQASAWIPMNSETCDGGIYVVFRPHESPFTEKEIELLAMIGTVASSALRRLETRNVHEAEPEDLSEFHGMIGASKPIKEVYSQIQMAAGNAATVLIEGESGTGKELVAKAIHATGPRAKEQFIAVDCGAIPEGLIEAELFGAKRGSYTGAVADRPGLFEAAHRGTIFLDEISNTTPALQAKLLRVIQEREVRRIGETKGRAIDVRLIVASNRSLEALVDAGQFRKDLLYRLRVLHIKVPPLRSRLDDIPMLAYAFLQKLNTANKTRKYFAPGVVNQLSTHRFPGNVRELQNAIERAFFLSRGILISDVPLEEPAPAGAGPADEVQNWFKDISEGRKDFWSAIHNRYKRRDISREKILALVDFGLRSTRGSYKAMASKFHLKEREYRRFMDFLRRNDCLLDFRPYRKAATASRRED